MLEYKKYYYRMVRFMEKKLFTEVEVEIINIDAEDIITTSNDIVLPDDEWPRNN